MATATDREKWEKRKLEGDILRAWHKAKKRGDKALRLRIHPDEFSKAMATIDSLVNRGLLPLEARLGVFPDGQTLLI